MSRLMIRRDFAALEMRRRAGVALLKKGATQTEVARKLGVSRQAVHEWWTAYQQGGLRALWHRKTPGRPRTLTTEQRQDLLKLLGKGALNYGFPTDLWTLERIAQLIRQEFGIAFHRSHVHRILVAEKWSCQVPKLQARERNKRKIRRWIRTTWRDAKKKPRPSGRRWSS
jgi:transposase